MTFQKTAAVFRLLAAERLLLTLHKGFFNVRIIIYHKAESAADFGSGSKITPHGCVPPAKKKGNGVKKYRYQIYAKKNRAAPSSGCGPRGFAGQAAEPTKQSRRPGRTQAADETSSISINGKQPFPSRKKLAHYSPSQKPGSRVPCGHAPASGIC